MLSPPEESHATKDGATLSELVGQSPQAVSCFAGANKTKPMDSSGDRIQLQGSITKN